MKANPVNHELSSSHTVEFLGSEGTQDTWNLNGEGSNVLILPGKKRTKAKVSGKISRSKVRDTTAISKSKQRKLKKLQDEKEKKLMLSKSIKMLQKYKLRNDAYSILQSSGTIGQAETVREKHRLAVQFSKAGLEVPEDVSLFKKDKQTSENGDVVKPSNQTNQAVYSDDGLPLLKRVEKDDCDGCTLRKLVEKNDCNVASRMKSLEKGNSEVILPAKPSNNACSSQQCSPQSHLKPTIKSPMNVNESDMLFPPLESATKISNKYVDEVTKSSISSSINDNQSNASIQRWGADGANICPEKLEVTMHRSIYDHANSAIVVHVLRPHEVEEKRRNLPIILMEQEIIEAINEHPILILCGETGCGKTTQVPQFLYEAGYGSSNYNNRKGVIGITQPRRIAVLATAKRVSYELGLHLGKEVGFQVRHDKMIGNSCSIKFMTDGILLREAQTDFLLKRYSVIILDEAHERSLNTDILIGLLSRIIKIRQELYEEQQKKLLSGDKISPKNMVTRLKLVLMSATLRVEDFISNKRLFHQTPPVLEVPVRQFPVTIHFSKKTPEDYLGQAYKKVLSIHKRLLPGGILVFATGQREVEYLCKKLRKASQKFYENSFKKKVENATPTGFELDMKDINEASGMQNNIPHQHSDRLSSYELDAFEEIDELSSDSDSGSESESAEDSEGESNAKCEGLEGNGFVLDFLRNPESLSSLKAAFEALAGNQRAEKKSDLQSASTNEDHSTEPTAVGPLYVLPLYAMLPASEQLRVFENVPEGERLVVVATNVAETSLTIPSIKYVVDTGKEKAKNYNYCNGMATYEVQWISKASAAQRAGRAGRTGPGHCYRLYSSAAFGKDDIFPEFSCPEISKIPVDGIVLLMKFMGIDKVANFPFLTPPKTTALEEAEHCLKAIEALDEGGKLTSLGRAMAQYPMSPRHSCMILTVMEILRNQVGFARANLVLGYAVAAAASLSFPNPFLMQLDGSQGTTENNKDQEVDDHDEGRAKVHQEKQREKKMKTVAKESRTRFCNPSSDALTVAYVLQLFELAENPFDFCRNNFIHLKTMEEMSKLRKQILQLIFHQRKSSHEVSWDHGSIKDMEAAWLVHSNNHPLQMNEEELLRKAICAGWTDRVAKKIRTISRSDKEHKVHAMRYQSCTMDGTVYLHSLSSVSQIAPEFLVYNELLCTNRPYMHGVTSVKSEWLVRYSSSLCSFSAPLTDPKPFYEPFSDRIFCWVSPTFGRHNWQLPLHSLPIKNEVLRISVFACALLEGSVLPCMKSAKELLAAPPSSILRPEALGQRRVGDLLSRLRNGSRTVDSRAKLKEAWCENSMFLNLELRNWFQERFHGHFQKLWEQLHREALIESCELFPKRAKKDKKIAR